MLNGLQVGPAAHALGLPNGTGVLITGHTNTVGGTTSGSRNVISGNSADGVDVTGVGATGNVVLGNFIGTDVNGSAALANGGDGVALDVGAAGNTIGGAALGAGNVISGNTGNGVEIGGPTIAVSGNVVLGNFIGTDVNGTAKLGNADGVLIYNGSVANTIGGTASGAGNLISGNSSNGVEIKDAGTSGNLVLGNFIGTDVNGTASLGNSTDGVRITAPANTIGGTTSGAGNVISGNNSTLDRGVDLAGSGASANVVVGNLIGTDVHGTAKLGNYFGIAIRLGAAANTIGGTASGAGNVVSGNVYGLFFQDGGTSGNVVLGNFIGTDKNGVAKLGNGKGITFADLSVPNLTANTIGGTASGAGNVISGNDSYGVQFNNVGTSGNVVLGNFIGTDKNGTAALGNGSDGVIIHFGATANTIGGAGSGAGNLISGNSGNGVEINGASGNLVEGNLIGTDINGTAKLGNTNDGVLIDSGATANSIDAFVATPTANVISGNGNIGVEITGSGTSGNVVFGNLIGTDKNGTAKLGNTADGVNINSGAAANTIGGTASGAGNVVSGNSRYGVYISGGSSANLVVGNFIGTDKNGTAALGNSRHGVDINQAESNTIGGTASGAANVISGNGLDGVYVYGTSASGNLIIGNRIGTDKTGTAGVANSGDGVGLDAGATRNTVGGTATGAANVISGNDGSGVEIGGSTAIVSGNVVLGNKIGTDTTGTATLPNFEGVLIQNGANANTIGGTVSGAGNLISGNSDNGVEISGSGTSGNVVLGNLIGADVHGAAALGNGANGMDILGGASSNTVGGTAAGAGNVISGNSNYGLSLTGTGTSGNVVLGNKIGTDVNGAAALGNSLFGVYVASGATANTVGGAASGAANVISGNRSHGVQIQNSGTSGNLVLGNKIGADISGTAALGNIDGVLIFLGATSNTVGGSATGAANVISGNRGYGIDVEDGGTSGNVVLGNLIGADVHGAANLGNAKEGVHIGDANSNTVGGAASGAANVISGNGYAGVSLGGTGNVVLGNLIGTDVHGAANLGNGGGGVNIYGSANTVGGAASGAANVISGNDNAGVSLGGAGNVVLGNKIGADVHGTAMLGNAGGGVDISGSTNTVGGTASGAANVISGNEGYGVQLYGGASGNVVLGNKIGADVNGAAMLGNSGDGVFFESTSGHGGKGGGGSAGPTSNTIGGTASGAANVISGNNSVGVYLTGSGTSGNVVLGNLIGTAKNGSTALGNSGRRRWPHRRRKLQNTVVRRRCHGRCQRHLRQPRQWRANLGERDQRQLGAWQ